jgi:hypothetical protein
LNFSRVTDVHFDDETPVQRAQRRLRHWTPVRTTAPGPHRRPCSPL